MNSRSGGGRKGTNVAGALEENTGNLALLDVRQAELKQPLARVDVILRTSQHQLKSDELHKAATQHTSLLMRTTKTLLRMSVFIPCALASWVRVASDASVDLSRLPRCGVSTSGSPPHAAPTIHHLPLDELKRMSARVMRRASGVDPGTQKSNQQRSETGWRARARTLLLKAAEVLLETAVVVDGSVPSGLDLVVLEVREALDHEARPQAVRGKSARDERK